MTVVVVVILIDNYIGKYGILILSWTSMHYANWLACCGICEEVYDIMTCFLTCTGNVNIGLIPVSTGQATTHAIVPMAVSKAGLDSKQVS